MLWIFFPKYIQENYNCNKKEGKSTSRYLLYIVKKSRKKPNSQTVTYQLPQINNVRDPTPKTSLLNSQVVAYTNPETSLPQNVGHLDLQVPRKVDSLLMLRYFRKH